MALREAPETAASLEPWAIAERNKAIVEIRDKERRNKSLLLFENKN